MLELRTPSGRGAAPLVADAPGVVRPVRAAASGAYRVAVAGAHGDTLPCASRLDFSRA
jgi:hypothetical protein